MIQLKIDDVIAEAQKLIKSDDPVVRALGRLVLKHWLKQKEKGQTIVEIEEQSSGNHDK